VQAGIQGLLHGEMAYKAFEQAPLPLNPPIEIDEYSEEMASQMLKGHRKYNTVFRDVRKLVSLGILEQTTPQKRNRRFVYREYLEILNRDIRL